MRGLPLSRVYQLIEPGPVVLLTTAHDSERNVMAMSWHMMVDFELPLIACIVSDRGDHSFMALRETKECVIAIPPVELAAKVVAIGNCSGREVDKFATFRLTPKTARRVSAPLVAECFANIECRVVDTRPSLSAAMKRPLLMILLALVSFPFAFFSGCLLAASV